MKINNIKVKGNGFAYDGCHKIYILENLKDMQEAISRGYEIYDIKELKNKFYSSCGLQFISNWRCTINYVNQFEDAIFEEDK